MNICLWEIHKHICVSYVKLYKYNSPFRKMDIIDKLQNILMIDVKPSPEFISTQRKRVFYHTCALIFCLVLCAISLKDIPNTFRAVTMFHVPGTTLHIGFQPILLALTLCQWSNTNYRSVFSLLCTLPYLWGHSLVNMVILFTISWVESRYGRLRILYRKQKLSNTTRTRCTRRIEDRR